MDEEKKVNEIYRSAVVDKSVTREEKPKVQIYKVPHCAFPKCYGDGKIVVSGSPFCRKHAEWAEFFLWIATQIKMKDPNVRDSGLLIPK
jgi:hypothetical protein